MPTVDDAISWLILSTAFLVGFALIKNKSSILARVCAFFGFLAALVGYGAGGNALFTGGGIAVTVLLFALVLANGLAAMVGEAGS